MKLITKQIRKETPFLYETEDIKMSDKIVRAKYFCPVNQWTWYLIELDKDNNLAFGYVVGLENGLGYFSINELENITLSNGLKIERDIYFKSKKLGEILSYESI